MGMLKTECPICHKQAKLNYETNLGVFGFRRVYSCGHTIKAKKSIEAENVISENGTVKLSEDFDIERFENEGGAQEIDFYASSETFNSLDGEFRAYPFQIEGVKFAERSGFKCLIADEMGLGKTVQALITVKRHRDLLCPVLFAVKGSTQLQWCKEIKRWLDDSPLGVMPIMNRESIIPGFAFYVISIDFLSRKGVLDRLAALGIKFIVLDECQNFKNTSSKRTRALIQFIQDNQIEYRMMLSGTPIKNRANEYFVPLNLLDPEKFNSPVSFCRYWLIPNEKGVYTRIDPYMMDQFREMTSKYIIRREKRDVLTNLPPLTRDYQYIQIDDPHMKGIYNNQLDLFQNFLRTASKINSTVLLGWLAKMRAITGQAKVPWAIEYAQQFLDETEFSLALGIHHHSVRDTLYYAFKAKGADPLKLSGEDNIFQKDRVQTAFNEGRNRLLIINCVAGGVGLNLQKNCSDFVVLERQWNSADEEQFEARFDRDGQKRNVNGVYPIAAGTIDEWFHDLVSQKRKILKETMGDKPDISVTEDEEFLLDLANKTVSHKLK